LFSKVAAIFCVRMRPYFSPLILALTLAAGRLGAQEPPARNAPLLPGPVLASPDTVDWTIRAAQSAQELGFPATAAGLFRDAIAQTAAPAERHRLTIALATALLDDGQLAEAESALNTLAPPYDSAWNLRAGLVQVQKRTAASLGLAGGHLAAIKAEELTPEDKGWWYCLQGRLAEAAGDAPRAQNFYDQAVAAAVSETQRTRFRLYRSVIFVRLGPVTDAEVDQQRQNALAQRGTLIGPEITYVYAAYLSAANRGAEAVNVLREQLTSLAPFQQAVRDRILLMLGLIATTKSDAGRTALLQLLESGSTRDSQRMALRLLVNEPQATEFRRRLDVLIAAAEPHPILEDLLISRAQLAAAEKTPAGYARASADANDLLTRFPGSELKPLALALLATMEWEQKRYLGAASFAAGARAVANDSGARARLGLLEAEALFRAPDYRRAAAAYDAVLAEPPSGVPAGDLLFQRLQAEIEATDFSVKEEVARTTALLDKKAADPAFDTVNRWQAEWNLARKLRASNQTETAYRRVSALLGSPTTGTAALPPELRARMAWLQAQLSLEAGQPETTIRLASALGETVAGVSPALSAEIRSTSVLLMGRAEISLGRDKDAIATFDRLRREFKTSDAAASSVLIQAEYYKGKELLTEAQALLRKMEADFPKDSPYVPQALYNAALIDERKGDRAEAVKRLDQLATAYPKSPLVFAARLKQADLYRELKDFSPAQQIYNRLTLDYPNDPRVFEAEMGLADSYNALATADASAAERAAERYERLLDLANVRLDLRVEAGFKLGLIRQQRGKPEEAVKVWWRDVVTPFLIDANQARRLGSSGRIWMGRTLTYLAELYDKQNRPDDAREARRQLVQTGLPGREEAARRLAPPAAAGTTP
jgi:hypothetical protein